MYLLRLEEREFQLYLIAGVALVVIAFILSIIALQSYVILEKKIAKINLMNGLHQSVSSIFNYSPCEAIRNVTLHFVSYCKSPINITLV